MASPSDRAYLAGTACTVRSRNPPDTHWENLGAFPANFATELNAHIRLVSRSKTCWWPCQGMRVWGSPLWAHGKQVSRVAS